MKLITVIFLLFFLFGCAQNKNDIAMSEFKLKDGRVVELKHSNGGATTSMRIRVGIKNKDTLIDELEGFSNTYIISFNQISDTLLQLTLTDTAYFKGKRIERLINLNNRITTYNKGWQ